MRGSQRNQRQRRRQRAQTIGEPRAKREREREREREKQHAVAAAAAAVWFFSVGSIFPFERTPRERKKKKNGVLWPSGYFAAAAAAGVVARETRQTRQETKVRWVYLGFIWQTVKEK